MAAVCDVFGLTSGDKGPRLSLKAEPQDVTFKLNATSLLSLQLFHPLFSFFTSLFLFLFFFPLCRDCSFVLLSVVSKCLSASLSPSACLPVCLSVCLPACLAACLSACVLSSFPVVSIVHLSSFHLFSSLSFCSSQYPPSRSPSLLQCFASCL